MNTRRRLSLVLLVCGLMLIGVVLVPVWRAWKQATQRRLNHQLIEAIEKQNALAVQQCLSAGADANATLVLEEEQRPLWRRLLDNLPGNRPQTVPQMWYEETPTALTLATRGFEIHAGGGAWVYFTRLPLNHVIVQALLDHGANPSVLDGNAKTPMHYALENLPLEDFQRMVRCGGSTGFHSKNGPSLFSSALRASEESHSKMLFLLEHGMPVDNIDVDGESALTEAIISETGEDIIEAILQHGANINAQNKDGKTVLMIAAEALEIKGVKRLLKQHPDLKVKDRKGNTVLKLARTAQVYDTQNLGVRDEIVRLLEQAGATE